VRGDAVENTLCRTGIRDQAVDILGLKPGIFHGTPGGLHLEIEGGAPGQPAKRRLADAADHRTSRHLLTPKKDHPEFSK
jgi:hypothetical protein